MKALAFKFTNNNSRKPKRVIMLGSSGIIATNLQTALKKKKINILAIGRSNLNLKNENVAKFLKKKIKNNDVVVFIAAEAPVKNDEMFFNNLKICNTVCKSLEKKKIQQLIYISSDAVYGDEKKRISEKSGILPGSLHGQMHATREAILKNKFSKILCILRPTLIYGAGDTHNGYGPNRFINLALKNNEISIFGNGEERRDHIFVNDLIEIIIKCLEKRAIGILNLASGRIYSFRYVAEQIIKYTKSKSKLKKIKRIGPMPHNGYRPFNIKLLKRNFKNVKLSNIKIGVKKYLADLDHKLC